MGSAVSEMPPFFLEPHGWSSEAGPLDRLRHSGVAFDDGFVLVTSRGEGTRCYFSGGTLVRLPGQVTRTEAEAWLEERHLFYPQEEED